MRIKILTRWLLHYLLPAIILAGSGIAFYVMGSPPDIPRKPKPAPGAIAVEVVPVAPLDGALVFKTTGEVVPHRLLSIASGVPGRITWRRPGLHAGEQVEAGDLLFRIDPQRFALAVERLEILLNQATNGLLRVQQNQANFVEQLALARKSHQVLINDVDRKRKLVRSKAIQTSEFQAAEKLELDVRLAIAQIQGQQRAGQIELASQDLAKKLAAVELQVARLDKAAAEIRAPISGIVTEVPHEEHAMAQVGDSLLTIEESGLLEVHCHLKIEEMEWVWRHQPDHTTAKIAGTPGNSIGIESVPARRLSPVSAEIVYGANGKRHSIKGSLVRLHGAGLDPATRTVPCRVMISTKKVRPATRRTPLMTGMFVTVHVRCKPYRPLLKIPARALRTNGSVWLMQDGILCPTAVRTVQLEHDFAIVDPQSSSIKPGDKVIVSPVANARHGLAVRRQVSPAVRTATPGSAPLPVAGKPEVTESVSP